MAKAEPRSLFYGEMQNCDRSFLIFVGTGPHIYLVMRTEFSVFYKAEYLVPCGVTVSKVSLLSKVNETDFLVKNLNISIRTKIFTVRLRSFSTKVLFLLSKKYFTVD